ncbi:hypothetical protein TeGR_g78, partial [Tetraparma gracilis]
MVNSNCDLKICDFGLARIDFPNLQWKASAMTDYVATRWYRAPEIIVGWGKYSKAVDVWSIGCILGELIVRKPLFTGGDNNEQLELICDLIGCPNANTIAQVRRAGFKEYLEELSSAGGEAAAQNKLAAYFRKRGVSGATDSAVDLLGKILRFDPEERLTAEQILMHPYFEQLYCDEDKPSGVELPMDDFDFEQSFATPETMRREIMRFLRIAVAMTYGVSVAHACTTTNEVNTDCAALTDTTINDAVSEWVDDAGTAETTYGHIRDWFTGDVTIMESLFDSKGTFDEDIGGWDTSKVTTMRYMFEGAAAFDQDISGWDTSKCTDMQVMFNRAAAFNQDISGWDTSKCTNMFYMFNEASAFSQDISPWCVQLISSEPSNFGNAGTDPIWGAGNCPTACSTGA